MTTIDPTHDAPQADATASEPRRPLPFVAHLGLLLLVLLGVVLATSPQGSLVADDGSYQLQLRALDQGAWEWTPAGSDLDPDGAHQPIANSDRTADGYAPFAKHPAWPWITAQIARVTGVEHAYEVLGVLGILGLASVAWSLAGLHEERWRRWAFWLAGTAPVAVTAAVPWAHAAAAALAGLAVLGAVHLVRRPSSIAAIAMLAVGATGAILLRTEGLLLAGAVAVALVVGGREAKRSWIWSLGAGGLTVALALAVVKVEAIWIESITGGRTTTFDARGGAHPSSPIEARVQATTRSLIDNGRPGLTALLAIVVVAAAVTAWLVASGRPKLIGAWQGAAGLSLLLLVVRVLQISNYPVTGLAAAWPVGVAGVAAGLAVAWTRVRMEVTVAAIYAAAILATQYADGGAGAWGGRFFAVGTAPLVIVAVLGIERLLAVAPSDTGSLLTARRFLVGLTAIPFLLGLAVVHEVQASNADLYTWIDHHVLGVGITPADELPRMMWQHPDVPWLVVDDRDDGRDLTKILGALAEPDGHQVTIVTLDRDLPDVAQALDRSPQWQEFARDQRDGLTVIVLRR